MSIRDDPVDRMMMLIIIIFFMTGLVLIGIKRSDDLTRHIFLEAHNCYAQDMRAVLHTDGTIECRSGDNE